MTIHSDGKYWRWARLRVANQEQVNSRMFALVQEIKISHYSDPQTVLALLQSIQDDVTLQQKKLTVVDGALQNLNPGLVSRALLKLKDFSIQGNQPVQIEAIFAGITNSANISLRYLNLDDMSDVVQVAPDTVAQAAMKLEFFKAWFSFPQVKAVLTRLAASQDCRLRMLKNYSSDTCDISSLDPEIVAGALTKLESISKWSLSGAQLAAIFSAIPESPVVSLWLSDQNISHVSPLDLVSAIRNLKSFNVLFGWMTSEQATAILTMVEENRLGNIKKITICFPQISGSVSPSLIQRAKQNSNIDLTWRWH